MKIIATSGSVSTSATITMQPVPAPSGLVVSPSDRTVGLKWNDLGYGVTDYRIYRSSLTTPTWTQVASIPATSSPAYTDTTPLNGETYYYQVSGYSSDSAEGVRSASETAVLPQKLASISLQLPSSTIIGQSFTATVTATDDNGNPYRTGLTAAMSEDGTGALTAPASVTIPAGSSAAGGSLTYVARGPSTGPVKITATASGAAPASATISVLPVPAPNGLVATAGDHSASLTWNALGYGVTNYRIYRSTATTAWSQIASVSATSSPAYTDSTATNGDVYYYQVSGYSTATDEGLRSSTASATLLQKLGSISLQVPNTTIIGQSFTATVTATDDNGNPYGAASLQT